MLKGTTLLLDPSDSPFKPPSKITIAPNNPRHTFHPTQHSNTNMPSNPKTEERVPPLFRNYRSLVALADYVVAARAALEDAYSRITLPPGFGEVDKIIFCKRRVHRKTRFRNRRFGKPSSIQRLCLGGPRIPRRRPYAE